MVDVSRSVNSQMLLRVFDTGPPVIDAPQRSRSFIDTRSMSCIQTPFSEILCIDLDLGTQIF